MDPREWQPGDIDRIENMTGLPPEIDAFHQRDWMDQMNRRYEDWEEWDKGYRAFIDGEPQCGSPSDSAWPRGWEYAALEDDDD